MFTGIVEETGIIKKIDRTGRSASVKISAKEVLNDLKTGDSVAVNGVCLTVTKLANDGFFADIMAETLRHTNLESREQMVNLERALPATGRFGGHIVTGHIDGKSRISAIKKEDWAVWMTIVPPPQLLKYIVSKGSVALDGVSLTVANVDATSFKVCIILHTQKSTTLVSKKIGDFINLECDIIGKYTEKLVGRDS